MPTPVICSRTAPPTSSFRLRSDLAASRPPVSTTLQYCEVAFVTSAIGDANAAFDGWVLELEILCRVRLAQNNNNDHHDYVSVYEPDANGTVSELRLPVNRRVILHQMEDISDCDIAQASVATRFIPFAWNQGGYDATMYRDGCLYFFQIARNTAHTEKWTPVSVTFTTQVPPVRRWLACPPHPES